MLSDDCLKCQLEFENFNSTFTEDLDFSGMSSEFNETDYSTGFFNESDFLNLTTVETMRHDSYSLSSNITQQFVNYNVTNMVYCSKLNCSENSDIQFEFDIHDLHHILPQIILAVIAIILNIAELYLMKKRKKYFPSEYLMISLAVADFLFSVLVVVALTLSLTYESNGLTGQIVDECVETLISFSIIASILHVVGISIDRLIAVIFPLRHRVRTDTNKMKRVVFSIWLITLAFIASVSVYKYHRGLNHRNTNQYSIDKKAEKVMSYTIFISCSIVALIYLTITRRLAMQASFLRSFQRSTSRRKQNKTKNNNNIRRSRVETVALLTACIVTVSFLLCTLPYACLSIVNSVSHTFHTVCLCLLVCNSVCNPIVYFWRGHWLKAKRRKSVASALTDLSKSRSSTHSNTISTVARSAAVACIPIRDGLTVIGQSGKYDLNEMTVMDIFDFDSINRYRRFNRSYYNQSHEFIMT